MAKIVFGAGVSHTPVLALDPGEWHNRARADLNNPGLNTSDGRFLTYAQLEAEVGTAYKDEAQYDVYFRKSAAAQAALDRVADELAAAAPDVVLIVGDDQEELFSDANQPAFAIFHGEELVMSDHYFRDGPPPDWLKTVAKGYGMDEAHRFPAAGGLGRQLIEQLMDREVDVTSVAKVADPKAGFGHAFGFVITRLFRERAIPVLPVLLNTYYPPNVPTASRCLAVGRRIREAIEAVPDDLTVAVIASGGLSHFVVDEALDHKVLEGLRPGKSDILGTIGRGALNSGSSEILNWVMAAGAVEHLRLSWTEYQPVFRTPAGTGVGVAFAVWQPEGGSRG